MVSNYSLIPVIIKTLDYFFNPIKHKISPRGNFFWNALIADIHWKEAWLNPYKFCMLNKVKEVAYISKYFIKSTHVKLYQQALLAWKLCHSHNFSPHKAIIWNNECITRRNKSLYLQKWVDRDIIFLKDLFDGNNQLLN